MTEENNITPTLTLAQLYEAQKQFFDVYAIYKKLYEINSSEDVKTKLENIENKIFNDPNVEYNNLISQIFSVDERKLFRIITGKYYEEYEESMKPENREPIEFLKNEFIEDENDLTDAEVITDEFVPQQLDADEILPIPDIPPLKNDVENAISLDIDTPVNNDAISFETPIETEDTVMTQEDEPAFIIEPLPDLKPLNGSFTTVEEADLEFESIIKPASEFDITPEEKYNIQDEDKPIETITETDKFIETMVEDDKQNITDLQEDSTIETQIDEIEPIIQEDNITEPYIDDIEPIEAIMEEKSAETIIKEVENDVVIDDIEIQDKETIQIEKEIEPIEEIESKPIKITGVPPAFAKILEDAMEKKEREKRINNITEPEPVDPIITESVVTEAEYEEPVITESVVTEPVYEEPVITESVVTEAEYEEPVISESVVTEPVYEEPVITESVVTEAEYEEPVITESVVSESEYEEPVITEPVVAEAEYEESVIIEPVIVDKEYEAPIVITPISALQEEYHIKESLTIKDLASYILDNFDNDGKVSELTLKELIKIKKIFIDTI
jgi:hypothetical protein